MIKNNKLQGVVKTNTGIQQINDDVSKLVLVIEENTDKYPSSVSVEFFNQRAALAKNVNVWDEVEVSVNFRCKEYNGRYYTTVMGWWLDILSQNNKDEENTDEDDLPF